MACNRQIWYVLLQKIRRRYHEAHWHWSRTLTDHKKSLVTTQRKCLAVIKAVLLLRHYLRGCRIILRTDHHALQWVLKLADARGKLACWRLQLVTYDFEILHTAGMKQQVAETLFRLLTAVVDNSEVQNEIPVIAISRTKNTIRRSLLCQIGHKKIIS